MFACGFLVGLMSLMLVRFKFSANIGMMCFVVYVGCLFLLSGLVGWLFL